MIKLPQPKFKVTPQHTKDEHFYRVSSCLESVVFGGITGRLDWVGGPKVKHLTTWGVKISLGHFQASINTAIKNNIILTEDLVQEMYDIAKPQHEEVFHVAGHTGTFIHDAFDKFIAWKRPVNYSLYPGYTHGAITGLAEWWSLQPFKTLKTEVMVASKVHGYGGTFDWLGIDTTNGMLMLGDLKSSNSLHPEYAAQLAALNVALFETYGVSAEKLFLFKVSKIRGSVNPKIITEPKVAFDLFLHAKGIEECMKTKLIGPWED